MAPHDIAQEKISQTSHSLPASRVDVELTDRNSDHDKIKGFAVSKNHEFDRGCVAWTQCLGSFCLFLSTWGIINSFGVYQSYYEESFLHQDSASRISWIGSIQAFLVIFGGVAAGPIFDRGHLKYLLWLGSFLVVFGMMMTSICFEYWQVVLAQGVVVGLGSGCLFVPSVAVLPTFFFKRRALAMGIAAAGVSVGGLIFPVIFRQLQPRIGFGWATRVIAFIMLAMLFIPAIGLRTRGEPSPCQNKAPAAGSAWKEPPFVFFAIGTFLAFVGLYVPYFYIQVYGLEREGVSRALVSYLVSLLNGGALIGRIIPNYFADEIGPLNAIIVCCACASIVGFSWIAIENTGSIIVFCLIYGFFSGGFISLGPTVVVSLSPSLDVVGSRMGMLFGPCSIGLLIGNPIAGALLHRGWVSLQLLCGATLIGATLCLILARVTKDGLKLYTKS